MWVPLSPLCGAWRSAGERLGAQRRTEPTDFRRGRTARVAGRLFSSGLGCWWYYFSVVAETLQEPAELGDTEELPLKYV